VAIPWRPGGQYRERLLSRRASATATPNPIWRLSWACLRRSVAARPQIGHRRGSCAKLISATPARSCHPSLAVR